MAFHKRFNIKVSHQEALSHFVNRILNDVFDVGFWGESLDSSDRDVVMRIIATDLGQKYYDGKKVDAYIDDDFYRCLMALESFRRWASFRKNEVLAAFIDGAVSYTLERAEVDLGIEWQNGIFVKKGAASLDKALVNDPLHWLDQPQYDSVRLPYGERRTRARSPAIVGCQTPSALAFKTERAS